MTKEKYMKIIKVLFLILLIPLGALLFVYAEYDDSPGGQLIGVVVGIVGIVGLIRAKKKSS